MQHDSGSFLTSVPLRTRSYLVLPTPQLIIILHIMEYIINHNKLVYVTNLYMKSSSLNVIIQFYPILYINLYSAFATDQI